ncbi:putative PIN family toxin of toxin-antitoxin system [Anoxybacillus tepidamans]|uniref:Putative PIN family toxin of toxin-antitoxin system n=1 Tax=Anoxybacteroides tepidamans TaxID=265948 RepID=A0A7W8IV57_9BACL|nr:putative toxin-antitoxin system toxin component, PIN family [Anoxybacillus tepidamans]MBB5326274.1 putative PIN family toxin of toxin-antitoxin system [Anoxybacillus tepidamans]
MRVLIDTNILISASLNSSGTPYQAYLKAVTYPNHGIVCDQNIDELRRVFNRKFPHKIQALEHFLSLALTVLEVIPTPTIDVSDEALVRDVSDRPILRAAIAAKVDILVTGDKDFLEAKITSPKIMTTAELVRDV